MTIREILETYTTVAVIGISAKPERPSHSVTKYLLHAGYGIVPVNPLLDNIFGLKCHPSLTDVPPELRNTIEVVNIFRKPDEVEPVVDQAIAIGAKVIWMQLGVTHDAAARKAEEAGLDVIQNRCIAVEHSRLKE